MADTSKKATWKPFGRRINNLKKRRNPLPSPGRLFASTIILDNSNDLKNTLPIRLCLFNSLYFLFYAPVLGYSQDPWGGSKPALALPSWQSTIRQARATFPAAVPIFSGDIVLYALL
ncbi:hypothetical protein DM01DRAFT_1011575 [Hesseltinella vesiculosa]|uniref:Uncharacterized protein n=1 Tax=Hesseltinella vesiculosa TaxID=101127 RepID=A0A1X2GZI9_9FUNG|nr:hypothetical protein DM01DRAFT_1011575 [Hesseltinella vesiculosa]